MSRFSSIRLRLTAWYTLALLLIIALFAIATLLLLQAQLYANLDQSLAARASAAVSTLDYEAQDGSASAARLAHDEATNGGGAGEQVLLFSGSRLLDQIGSPISSTQQAALLALPADGQASSLNLSGAAVRALRTVVADGGFSLVVVRPVAAVEQPLHNLLVAFVIAAPLALLLAAFGGLLITGRALRPIATITATTRAIGEHDLSRRLALGPPHDELTALATTIDEMLGRIEAGYERQRRFTADASHELRTPLAVVIAEADVALAGRRSVAEYRAALNSITLEANQIQQLVSDLLILARSDAHHNQPRQTINPYCLATQVAARLRTRAQAAEVTLIVGGNAEGAVVLGSEEQLARALLNLVDNAIKYGARGGSVSLALALVEQPAVGEVSSEPPHPGHFVALSVSNSGLGIAAAHLPHLFDRFYRADPARTRDQRSGSGLGLAIAASIAHSHGGWIGVQSGPQQGSRFILYLPVAEGNGLVSRSAT